MFFNKVNKFIIIENKCSFTLCRTEYIKSEESNTEDVLWDHIKIHFMVRKIEEQNNIVMQRTSSLPNWIAASPKTCRLPLLLPQKTHTVLNLLLGYPSSIQNRCFLCRFSIQTKTIHWNKRRKKKKRARLNAYQDYI